MKRSASLILLALTAWSCGGEETSGDLAEESTGAIRHALASDPSGVGTHGVCRYNYNWNGTRARVYHPANSGSCSSSVYGPLVVILHATGYDHLDYETIQHHLARNGFTSASIDVLADGTAPADHQAAADTAWTFVDDFLLTAWSKRFYVDPTSVALIGHSRGGDTVRYLADMLAGDPVAQVKAVVSLAPSSSSGLFLDGMQTVATLDMWGTIDGDVSYGGAIHHFDRSGSEGSQLDPTWDDQVTYKSLKLVHQLPHQGYSDGFAGVDTVKGYVLAFLKAHNHGDVTWYEDYIRGDAVPDGWPHPVFSSYSDGFLRRVIDNFDDGSALNSTIGGVTATFKATMSVLDLGANPGTYMHDTEALWMWGTGDGSLVTWTIPAGKRDASSFEWLSLRIAQTSGAPANDLRIQLRNGLTWSPELRLTDYGAIPQPTKVCAGICVTRSHLATIRVPLAAFGAHDDVQHVRFVFRGDSFPDTFVIDNLELSEWILKP
jgi:hypothetical protein